MALIRNFVLIDDLSSCDFQCVTTLGVTKLRVKSTAYVSDQTGTSIPGVYTAPVDGGTDLKDGAVIIEIFDDAIAYWTVDCDGVYTLTVTVPRTDTNTVTTFQDSTGGDSGLAPATPGTAPTTPVAEDTLIEKFDDYTNYWTFDGTNWVLDFQNSNVDANHNYDVTQVAVTWDTGAPVTVPTTPPANPVAGETLAVPYVNGTAHYSYDGTTWTLEYFDVDCCPVAVQNDVIGSVTPAPDGNITLVYNTSNQLTHVVLSDGTIITTTVVDINLTHENNATVFTDGTPVAEQPVTIADAIGDTAILNHPNGVSNWTWDGTNWVLDFFNENLDCCTTFNDQGGSTAPLAGTNATLGIPTTANTGDTFAQYYDDFTVFYTYDGTNWVEDFRIPVKTTIGSLDNVSTTADTAANDCDPLVWDATAGEWVPMDMTIALNCAGLTA